MPKKILIWSALLMMILITGCANGVVTGGSSLRREIDALKMEVADLRDMSRVSAGTGSVGGGSSDLRLEIDNIRTNLQRVTENIETASIGGVSLRQQLEYMSARLDRLEKKVSLPPLSRDVVGPITPPVVLTEPTSTVPATSVTVAPGSQTELPGPPAGTEHPEDIAAGSVPAVPAARSVYDQGKDLFDQKKYPEAIELFRQYIAAEPTGAQVAGAQFYIGESLYFQNKFEDAILEYQTVVSGFPKSQLVSTALLKQGLSFQALDDKASAKLLYQKVVRDYPKSYSAGIARERLKTI
ncbi:MAG: tol-pal system protein YbgF [Deltaproteobacteria bacterium]|jgi:tol-pal system protein YbgF|nr:tol-pal system protein YbgF [Deltaproteobacteria bacterium]